MFWGINDDHVCSGLVPRRVWVNELELDLNDLPQADRKPKNLALPALIRVEAWKVSYKLQIEGPFDLRQLLIDWDSVLISTRKYKFAQVSYRNQNFARNILPGGHPERIYLVNEVGHFFLADVEDDGILYAGTHQFHSDDFAPSSDVAM